MEADNFKWELFTEPHHYEESPLRDRKAFVELWRSDEKAEFVRDIISLANMSRIFGEPAYLLLGITNEGGICGIEQMYQHITPNDSEPFKCREGLIHLIGEIIHRNIEPPVIFELKSGNKEGKDVAYILIKPHFPPECFRVKDDFSSGKKILLKRGQCWIRFGESKFSVDLQEISPTDEPFCYSYDRVPYPLPSKWRRYFEGLMSENAILKAMNLNEYQTPKTSLGQELHQEVIEFLSGKERLLIISGIAGSGKSTFLQRLVGEYIEYGLATINEIIEREEFSSPIEWIPIYIPLRGRTFRDYSSFLVDLFSTVNNYGDFWGQYPKEPEKLFEALRLRWLICFDGLDEIWNEESYQIFLGHCHSLNMRYQQIKIIITTRPDRSEFNWEDWHGNLVELSLFSKDDVSRFTSAFAKGEVYDSLLGTLFKDDEISYLATIPAYLNASIEPLRDYYDYQIMPVERNIIEEDDPKLENPIWSSQDDDVVIDEEDIGSEESLKFDDFFIFQFNKEFMSTEFHRKVSSEKPRKTEPKVKANIESGGDTEIIEIGPLGIFLNRTYRYIWEREKKRKPLPSGDIDSWWYSTGRLAIEMDGSRKVYSIEAAKPFFENGTSALHWLLGLGILVKKSSIYIRFITEITKVYFASVCLLPHILEKDYEIVHERISSTSPEFQLEVHSIIQQLIPSSKFNSVLEGGPEHE